MNLKKNIYCCCNAGKYCTYMQVVIETVGVFVLSGVKISLVNWKSLNNTILCQEVFPKIGWSALLHILNLSVFSNSTVSSYSLNLWYNSAQNSCCLF